MDKAVKRLQETIDSHTKTFESINSTLQKDYLPNFHPLDPESEHPAPKEKDQQPLTLVFFHTTNTNSSINTFLHPPTLSR